MAITIETVDVWRSYGCDTDYSVSLCDGGGEIRCIGGDDDIDAAWALACETADDLGVPARIIAEGTEQVTRTYTPTERRMKA
jgi:hypothetical protein